MHIETEAIVLRSVKYSESDSILTLFTRKLGKVTAVAKGARRSKSTLMPCSQVFAHGTYLLYKSSSMYRVNQCDLNENFFGISRDIDLLSHAAYIANLTRNSIVENQTNGRLLDILLKTLYCYGYRDYDVEYITRIFELKYLEYLGYRPQISGCVNCQSQDAKTYRISIRLGGILCADCLGFDPRAERVDRTTIELMKYIIEGSFEKCVKARVSPIILKELKKVLRLYMYENIEGYEEYRQY